MEKEKPVGICLGWDLKPHLGFKDGKYLFGDAERVLYPEYFPNNEEWAVDPITKEKLEISRKKEVSPKSKG